MLNKSNLDTMLREYGVPQSEKTVESLDKLAEMLVEWNKIMNLTAVTDSEGMAIKHMLDSLMVYRYIDFPRGSTVVDVGCGAGFPSLPMLIARKDLRMTFLDGTGKKLKFIEAVMQELELSGKTLHMRAEDAGKDNVSRETYNFAVARAVARMNVLAEYALPLVKVGGTFSVLKGKNGIDEVVEAKSAIKTLGGKIEDIFEFPLPDGSERTIITIKKISHTPTIYPRASTQISKKPL